MVEEVTLQFDGGGIERDWALEYVDDRGQPYESRFRNSSVISAVLLQCLHPE